MKVSSYENHWLPSSMASSTPCLMKPKNTKDFDDSPTQEIQAQLGSQEGNKIMRRTAHWSCLRCFKYHTLPESMSKQYIINIINQLSQQTGSNSLRGNLHGPQFSKDSKAPGHCEKGPRKFPPEVPESCDTPGPTRGAPRFTLCWFITPSIWLWWNK